MTLSSEPNEFSKTITWFAMATTIVLCTTKIPTMTCVGSHKLLIKLTTITNVSCPPRDIQLLKDVVHVTHEVSEGKTYFFLVFFTMFANTFVTSQCQNGNTTQTLP